MLKIYPSLFAMHPIQLAFAKPSSVLTHHNYPRAPEHPSNVQCEIISSASIGDLNHDFFLRLMLVTVG